MKKSNKMDLISYIMLGIPSLLAFLFTIGIIGLTIYFGNMALTESADFGGWIFMIMMLLGIVVVPCLFAWILEWVLYIIGLVSYKKQKMGRARIMGLLSDIMGILTNLLLLGFCFGMMEDMPEVWIGLVVVLSAITYLFIPWIMLIVSICLESKKGKKS